MKLLEAVSYHRVDPQQGVGLGEELLLQGDDDDLHVAAGLVLEEAGHLDPKQKQQIQQQQETRQKEDADLESHLSDVAVVQRRVHLIQDEEGSRTEAGRDPPTPPQQRQT